MCCLPSSRNVSGGLDKPPICEYHMLERPSRRTALKQIAGAGVGATITPITIRGQTAPIRIAGMPVQIAIASVSPVTLRITVAAIAGTGGVPDDGRAGRRRGGEAAGEATRRARR